MQQLQEQQKEKNFYCDYIVQATEEQTLENPKETDNQYNFLIDLMEEKQETEDEVNKLQNERNIEYEIWQTSCKINYIDKEYKNQNPEEIKKGIISGANALGFFVVLCLVNKIGINSISLNVIGTIDIILQSLLVTMYLGPKATYKFRKKRLDQKLESLQKEKLNSMGIFTIDDYEVILDADSNELDKELFKHEAINDNENTLLGNGGKHVR